MKTLYYLIGILFVLYLFVLFYESKRERDFVKQDLEQGGIVFVNEIQSDKSSQALMREDEALQTAQKYGTTILDQMDNTFQGDLKRAYDDVKGAVPLRRN